ncbi:hypothetical protein ACUSIJ_25130 [Pseudochelatococcus sp. B33]
MALYYGNFADTATLSGGSWTVGLPLNNLKNRMLRRVARSTNANLTSTIVNVDLGAAQSIPAIFLGPYNASGQLKYRARGAANSGMTSPLHDSGWVAANVVPSLSLAWEDPGFWYGISSSGEVELRGWIMHFLPSPVSARYWRIEVDDTTNPAGYLQFGRLMMPKKWQPSINYEPGSTGLSLEDRTVVRESIGGSEYFWRRQEPRVFNCAWPYLKEEDTYGSALNMMRDLGTSGEVFVVPDPDSTYVQRRSFLGRMRSRDAIGQPIVTAHTSYGFEIREII